MSREVKQINQKWVPSTINLYLCSTINEYISTILIISPGYNTRVPTKNQQYNSEYFMLRGIYDVRIQTIKIKTQIIFCVYKFGITRYYWREMGRFYLVLTEWRLKIPISYSRDQGNPNPKNQKWISKWGDYVFIKHDLLMSKLLRSIDLWRKTGRNKSIWINLKTSWGALIAPHNMIPPV